MFELISSKMQNIFSGLKKKAVITEEDLEKTLREIRITLLEADVSLALIKEFLSNLKDKLVGHGVYKSISPAQMIIKAVSDQVTEMLLSEDKGFLKNKEYPAVCMMAGLQGAGKTTSVAKLAKYLQSKSSKKVLVVSVDLQRAAAYEQLQQLSKKHNIDFFNYSTDDYNLKHNLQKSVMIALEAKEYARTNNYDVLIIDSAGRLSVDSSLMEELKLIHEAIKPQEVLLVVDSMLGQAAASTAFDFNQTIKLTGVLLTKLDGDAKGGAALSIKYATNTAIKFVGTGEGVDSFELFDAQSISNRILGNEDTVALVEKFANLNQEEDIEGLTQRIKRGIFTMSDFKSQLEQINKLGGAGKLMGMLPGMSKIKNKIKESGLNDRLLKKQIALINSMSKKERSKPSIIGGSRKKRISDGAGAKVQDVNKLLKQFEQAGKAMKQFKKINMKDLTDLTKSVKNLT